VLHACENLPPLFGEEYKLRNSSLCMFLQSPIISSLFGPDILLNTLFSDSLCCSVNVRELVLRTCKTTRKITILCMLILVYLRSELETKDSELSDKFRKHLGIKLGFAAVVQNYLNFAVFKGSLSSIFS
jgi:hypothetical protein